MNQDLVNKITNICGIVIAVTGVTLGLQTQGVTLPPLVITICTALAAFAGAIIGYFTKKPLDK